MTAIRWRTARRRERARRWTWRIQASSVGGSFRTWWNYGNRWGSPNAKQPLLLEVAINTWARWERGELGVHPERARQMRRLQQLVERYGQSPLWGLGVAGLRDVLDGMTVPEALDVRGLDRYGAPKRAI